MMNDETCCSITHPGRKRGRCEVPALQEQVEWDEEEE